MCVLLLQNVVRMMSEKVGLRDPAEDGLSFSLHECRDGVTSTCVRAGWAAVVWRPNACGSRILTGAVWRCCLLPTVERALPSAAEVFPIMQDWDSSTGKAKFVFMCKLYTETIVNSDDPKIIYLLFIQVASCVRCALVLSIFNMYVVFWTLRRGRSSGGACRAWGARVVS